MKDKRQVPLKGDMALVLGVEVAFDRPSYRPIACPLGNGQVVLCISDPVFNHDLGIFENETEDAFYDTDCLYRIPPDAELKTMFGETEKPLEKV